MMRQRFDAPYFLRLPFIMSQLVSTLFDKSDEDFTSSPFPPKSAADPLRFLAESSPPRRGRGRGEGELSLKFIERDISCIINWLVETDS
ncbi:MAG: hypothetical protein A3G33_00335 [Omnitrophica bacterium RIFCSPLOWO2_12_FULL_44_17]|uniref:Uncharacterized protein n=1 Tax=Candidatus Danuiimicrobium aquiferis TaxID=1801832 RepID=A0A1G1KU04_9BACT|nr:MAG: hypothetical protein A3B72_01355 [Omnitrophica bacterium RIFCSPHIGHO2_02_FULL_45_28]OGW96411.1 MAG: hypothetical protein A3G33_00335 [Omnitrophica bacterium RIFCSPLOWO2_12_FULL_44_17]